MPSTRMYYKVGEWGGVIRIQYHSTEIMHFHPDGTIDISLGGWSTRTTLSRLNEFSPFSFYMWRRNRREDVVLAVDLNGGWGWWNKKEPQRKRTFLIYDTDQLIRVLPDKRYSPFIVDYQPFTWVSLKTVDWWVRRMAHLDKMEKRQKKRTRERLQKYRRWLYSIRRFMPHDKPRETTLNMIRDLLPEFRMAENRLMEAKSAVEKDRNEWTKQQFEMRTEIANLVRKVTQVEDAAVNSERERDEYMYQLDELRNSLEPEPPTHRQRSIVLEQP